jgi:hypothetical protein
MTKLLLQLAFVSLALGTVHAGEVSDHTNANMLWSDNEEFHLVNTSQEDPDLINSNMSWSDNEEFHLVNASQEDPDLINSNMSWSDDEEFQRH